MTAISPPLRLRREGALRSRAARGDAAAFAAVYERHHQALYRYCRSILRHEEDAQDALQSTMARAFAALQDESRDFELRPWLFRIAHNEAISILRRRRSSEELDDVPQLAGELEDQISDREQLRLLQLDLADLPERQRAALVLRELNGLSHAEIGVVLEISTSAVKQSIFEARTALFSCREGREMPCHDVRRMLSDGDGRVLRGRGVRAHLRTCGDCQRFRADLEQRPRALRALVPPLPVGTAAALLSQLIGGGTAAKLLACIAIAGGGTTLAVEVNAVREPSRAAAESATPTPRAKRAVVVPVAAKVTNPAPASTLPTSSTRTAPSTRVKPVHKRRPRAKPRHPAAAPAAAKGATPVEPGKPPKLAKAPKPAKKLKVAKPPKAVKKLKVAKPPKLKPTKVAKPPKAAKPVKTQKPGKPKGHK